MRPTAPPTAKSLICDSATRFDTHYVTLAERLKAAGYATGHFGKWHLGPEPYSPLQQGFEVDIPHHPGPGPASSFVAPWKFANFTAKSPGEHLEDRMAAEAVAWIEQNRDRPFFLNYWQFSVHAPFDAKKALIEKHRARVDPADGQRSPTYAAMVESLDDAIGTLLDALDRLGLADRTAIVFFSDNGGNMYNTVDGTTPTSNRPLRGGKATLWEGGIRVPAIVSWPGLTAPGTRSDAVIQSTDFYPTILSQLGLAPTPDHPLDGIDITPALRGQPFERGPLFTFFPHATNVPDALPPAVSVHHGDWKLIRVFHGGEKGAHAYHLHHLGDDLGETRNLAAAQPDRVRELDRLIDTFLTATHALVPGPNPAYDPKAPAAQPRAKGKAKPKPHAGWQPSAQAQLATRDGALVITSTGGDPHISTRVLPAAAQGPFTLRFRLSSTARGAGLVYYAAKPGIPFHRDRTVSFPITPDGQPRDHTVTLPAPTLAALRLDPGSSPGTITLHRIELRDAAGQPVPLPALKP